MMKIYWSRGIKINGRASIGIDNSIRAYIAKIKINGRREIIGSIYNTSYNHLNSDNKYEWVIMIYTNRGNNLTLKDRYLKDDIEGAKAKFELVYNAILESDNGPLYEYRKKLKYYGK